MERKSAISGVVQVKFLDLVPGVYVYFTHGDILENANGHICSLQHTTGILIGPVRTGALTESARFFRARLRPRWQCARVPPRREEFPGRSPGAEICSPSRRRARREC